MPSKILIAYKTRTADGYVPDIRDLPDPPSNWKDPDKIAAWREEKAKEASTQAVFQPYTGTFDEVQLIDLTTQEHGRWQYREPKSGRQPVCLAVRAWLLKHYPDAWPNSTHPGRAVPQAIFVGFNPKLFLRILGTECSLPANQPKEPGSTNTLPLSCWYGNSDHRDIGEAVKPDEFKFLSWRTVLEARGLTNNQAVYAGWNGPHIDVTMDLSLIIELASQLAMVGDD